MVLCYKGFFLRTDSTRVSDEAAISSKEYIVKNYGDAYAAETVTEKKKDQKIQDAHEAIRPTDIKCLARLLLQC